VHGVNLSIRRLLQRLRHRALMMPPTTSASIMQIALIENGFDVTDRNDRVRADKPWEQRRSSC